jgi:hypothetical protein
MKERLHDTLGEERDSSRLLVLCGLGGAGKSSLALNYLLSYRKDYSAVFWLHAASEESLRKDCEKIHRLLYGEAQSSSIRDIDGVKQWFQGRKSRYLWILDSADNVNNAGATGNIDLERYLPDASCVDVIVTTRSQSVQHMTSLPAIQVAELDRIEARDLFTRRAGMSSLTPQIVEDVDRIVESLGHFALAIKLAGAYVASNPYMKPRLGEYLSQLSADERGFLNQQPQRHIDRYEQSIRRSWELSCEAIADRCPVALNLLSFLAFVDPVDIEPEYFESLHRSSRFDEVSPKHVMNDRIWQTAITELEPWDEHIGTAFATLSDYSLIQWSGKINCYNMHQLVHSWAFDRLSKSQVHFFGTALLFKAQYRSYPNYMVTCFSKLTSVPNASTSDRSITLERFGTLGAYHVVTESAIGSGLPMRKKLWIDFEFKHLRLTIYQPSEEELKRFGFGFECRAVIRRESRVRLPPQTEVSTNSRQELT